MVNIRPPFDLTVDPQTSADTESQDGTSKQALVCKALTDKGWAEKQEVGFTTWLNFTLEGVQQSQSGDHTDDDSLDAEGELRQLEERGQACSGSPLKAVVAMVRASLTIVILRNVETLG